MFRIFSACHLTKSYNGSGVGTNVFIKTFFKIDFKQINFHIIHVLSIFLCSDNKVKTSKQIVIDIIFLMSIVYNDERITVVHRANT